MSGKKSSKRHAALRSEIGRRKRTKQSSKGPTEEVRRRSNPPRKAKINNTVHSEEGESTSEQEEFEVESVDFEQAFSLADYMDVEKSFPEYTTRRMSIAYFYVFVHNAPRREEWGSKDGTAAKIKKAMDLPAGTSITHILEDIRQCLEKGEEYDPSVKPGRGRKPAVEASVS